MAAQEPATAQAVPAKEQDSTQSGDQRRCRLCKQLKACKEGRIHGANFNCTRCESIQRMVARNLGSLSEVTGLEPDAQASFFKEAARKADDDGKLTWQVLRATLVTTKARSLQEERETGVVSEWLPESVWVTKGFSSEVVQACESKLCPKLGLVYGVPVEHDSWRLLHQDITKTLLTLEEDCRKKKKTGKKGSAEETTASDWQVPDALAAFAAGKGKGRAAASKPAAAPKAAAAKTARANAKLNVRGQKALSDLTGALLSLQNLSCQLDKRTDVAEDQKEAFRTARAELEELQRGCQAVVLQYAAVADQENQPPLPDLPVSETALKNKLQALKCLKAELPKKPKKAARDAGGAAEPDAPGAPKRRRTKQPA